MRSGQSLALVIPPALEPQALGDKLYYTIKYHLDNIALAKPPKGAAIRHATEKAAVERSEAQTEARSKY